MYYTVEPLSKTGTHVQTMLFVVKIEYHHGFAEQIATCDQTAFAPVWYWMLLQYISGKTVFLLFISLQLHLIPSLSCHQIHVVSLQSISAQELGFVKLFLKIFKAWQRPNSWTKTQFDSQLYAPIHMTRVDQLLDPFQALVGNAAPLHLSPIHHKTGMCLGW